MLSHAEMCIACLLLLVWLESALIIYKHHLTEDSNIWFNNNVTCSERNSWYALCVLRV